MNTIRSRADLTTRRRLAVARVGEGWSPADTAAFLGVHVETVRKWVRAHKAGGDAGLAGTPHPGRRPFLAPDQENQVRSWLAQSPTAFGFRTDLWTAARVAQLIRDRLGIAYHPNYLREWLTRRGYSPQKPRRVARQQKPEQVAEFLATTYPAVKKKSPRTTPTSC